MNSAFLGANVLVLGAGVTGTSVAKILENYGAHVSIFEENEKITVHGERVSATTAKSTRWEFVVVSPGWKIDHPVIQSLKAGSIPLISEVDLAWKLKEEINPNQVWLGVTGTNGKTTTVELTTAFLAAAGLNVAACGNVGDTVFETVASDNSYDFLVVELSSFQLEWSDLPHFHASAILNIADDHIDWHGNFDSYVAAKLRILERCETALLNADDENVVIKTASWRGKKVFYTLGSPRPGELGVVEELLVDRAFVSDSSEAEVIAELNDVRPKAAHSVSNTLAAAGLARSVGVTHLTIQSAIKIFSPGRHRIELILEANDVLWINDSKATNPHAAAASLSSFSSVIWIAGGLAKGAKMEALVNQVKGRVKVAILIGRDRELIANELRRQAPGVLIVYVDKDGASGQSLMEKVVEEAKKFAVSGDAVLLAPACASMDQFVSYADRGDQFSSAVKSKVVAK